MVTIDLSNEKFEEVFKKNLEKDYGVKGQCRVILPDTKSYDVIGYYSRSFFRNTNPETVSYNNGRYIGSKENPYMILFSIEEGTETLDVHPDTLIVNKMIKNLSDLKKLIINSRICYIYDEAFREAPVLEKIVFLNSESIFIGIGAFRDIPLLSSVEFDDNGEYLFQGYCMNGDTNLTDFVLPRKISNIGTNAFSRCGFKHAYVPKNIKQALDAFPCGIDVYYEGKGSELQIDTVNYISSDDYSRNFYSGPMSYSFGLVVASENPNYHCEFPYEEYLKKYDIKK